MNMSEKTTGYILLIAGIIIMIFATIQIVFVLTGKATPIKIFQTNERTDENTNTLDVSQFISQLQNKSSDSQFNSNTAPTIQLFNPIVLNKLLNLTIYYLIMQFLLGFGFKLSSLGTQLLRPLQVQIKNKNLESINNKIN
jgi:hypothetical protein